MKVLTIVIAGALLALSNTATAQPFWPEEQAPKLLTRWGMSLSLGGGATGFTDADMRDFADLGGAWDARFVVGTRKYIAFEAAYIGAITGIDALGLASNATLIANGVEGAFRFNFMPNEEWQPYMLAGAGWKHYSLDTDTNTSNVRDSDDVFEVPLGAGIAYRIDRFVVDLRGVFRSAFDANLVETPAQQGKADLHNWEAGLKLGYEF